MNRDDAAVAGDSPTCILTCAPFGKTRKIILNLKLLTLSNKIYKFNHTTGLFCSFNGIYPNVVSGTFLFYIFG